MKRDQVVKLVAWRLGNRKDMGERAIAELDFIQEQLLESNPWLPWFLEKDLEETYTSAVTRVVTLPADYLGEVPDKSPWISLNGEKPTRLKVGEYDLLFEKYPGVGKPQAYCYTEGRLHLFPSPDAAYLLQMTYYGKDAIMSAADVETLWLKHAADLVLACLSMELAGKHIQNPALAQTAQAEMAEAWKRLWVKHTALQEQNLDRSLGGNS